MTNRPNTEEVARLILHLMSTYGKRLNKRITRARLSTITMRKISSREKLREVFLDELEDELACMGWSMIRIKSGFGLIRNRSIESWPRIGWRRIKKCMDDIETGKSRVLDTLDGSLIDKELGSDE